MTIKEIRFSPPLESPPNFLLLTILDKKIKGKEGRELEKGIHDVTPDGYRDNYIVIVEDPGNGDNEGEVVVTRRGGKAISAMYTDGLSSEVEMEEVDDKRIPLRSGSAPVCIARPNQLDKPGKSGYKVHGAIYYAPKEA